MYKTQIAIKISEPQQFKKKTKTKKTRKRKKKITKRNGISGEELLGPQASSRAIPKS